MCFLDVLFIQFKRTVSKYSRIQEQRFSTAVNNFQIIRLSGFIIFIELHSIQITYLHKVETKISLHFFIEGKGMFHCFYTDPKILYCTFLTSPTSELFENCDND